MTSSLPVPMPVFPVQCPVCGTFLYNKFLSEVGTIYVHSDLGYGSSQSCINHGKSYTIQGLALTTQEYPLPPNL